jgi:hypothetical protein
MSEAGAPPSGFERRRSERIPVPPRGGPVSVVGARLVNVSAHGMLIESLVLLEREAQMNFRLVIAGEKVDVEARVAVCSLLSSGRRRIFGVGLEFTAMPEAARQRLADVLGQGAAPKPD